MADDRNASPVDIVLRDFGESLHFHDSFAKKVDKRYKAYRGVLERRSQAAKWTSKLHPPYVFQIIETIVGSMVEDRLSFRVTPRPFAEDSDVIQERRMAAEVLEYLLRYEQDIDNFQEKQRPFALQASITGLTVGKVYWKYAAGPVRRMRTVDEPVLHPETGQPVAYYPTLKPSNEVEVMWDDPTFEVVDVRDFFWHEAAPSLEKSKFVIHRVWMSIDELRDMAARGAYNKKAVDSLGDTRNFGEEAAERELSLFHRNRTKDMVEVLEYWTDTRQITIANRQVLLSDRPNPFWHNEKPFVVCSSMPDLFSIPGVSDVEIVEELQEMLWTVMNQRLDNLALINNAIILLRSDIDDPDMYEFAPGERWLVEDVNQVEMWQPSTVPAEVSLQAEQLIKSDMQDITGGMPFVAGQSDQQDQSTATGVSIVTTLAQKRLAAKKRNFSLAYGRVANQQVALLQQFMRDSRVIQIVGRGGDLSFLEIEPKDIQGRFNVEIDAMDDSMMRQERRAEAQAMIQVAANIAPVMASVGQPLNLQAFVQDWLRAYNVADPERYFSARPQQGPPGQPQEQPQNGQPQPGQPQPGQQVGAPTPEGTGMTSPLATAAQISPSHPTSMAPSTFMQRALAAHGGAANV